tara:strand:- start:501 stop:1718 length:1218 start_codon:yes stop_codon:yes gene_type:complete
MKQIITGIIVLFLFSACAKNASSALQSSPASNELNIVWSVPIMNNTSGSGSLSMNPILHENQIIINTEYQREGKTAPVIFLNSTDGSSKGTWSDYIAGNELYMSEISAYDGKFLLLSTGRSIDCINLQTRQTQWQSLLPSSGPFIYAKDNFIYTSLSFNAKRSAAIIRSPTDRKDWDTVYTFHQTDGFLPNFDSMGFGTLENGDAIIVWKNRSYRGSTHRTDIFAYNLNADSLMWRNTNFMLNSGVLPLQIENNKVYGAVNNQVFALELNNGITLWRRDFNDLVEYPDRANFDNGAMLIYDDAFILKGQGEEMVFLNKLNGALRRVVKNLPGDIRSRFTLFEGKLFFSAGKLVVVDALTTEVLLKSKESDPFEIIRSNIIIDPDQRYMYFHDALYLYCVRIPTNI